MNYTYLKYDDKLPAVGVLQKILNKKGAKLVPDGHFGKRTRFAVLNFQKANRLKKDGIVGVQTWPKLVADKTNLNIIDCVDVFHEYVKKDSNKKISSRRGEQEPHDLTSVGGKPILIGGMSNGVEQAITSIKMSAPSFRVFLLRFHGHGNHGLINMGRGGSVFIEDGAADIYIEDNNLSSIHSGNIKQLLPILGKLKDIFGPYGCIEFMHCSVAGDINGRQLLNTIANHLRIPVTAGKFLQKAGGSIATFKFEGSTYTAIPGGRSLKSWCQGLPGF